jgi:hypothetical protein
MKMENVLKAERDGVRCCWLLVHSLYVDAVILEFA